MITHSSQIKNFTIIGSGTLGARIGLRAALSGFKVVLYDIHESSFTRAKKDFQRIKILLNRKGELSPERFDELTESIIYTTDINLACRNTDFISESVLEDVQLKKEVWKKIGDLAPAHSILTTNTSYLLPSWFAKESGASERFCAFHFHDVFTARVVDIMPHPGTDPEIIEVLRDVGKQLHQIPVVIKKETQGYIFNKMFGSILMTAGSMWANGIASVEDIDRSWMGNYGMRIGPFGMMDEVGIDTVFHVAKGMDVNTDPVFVKKIEEMINNGSLGIKTGKGFYNYPHPQYKNANFLS
ncbi:MAG: 3-hydroxybutyryl-CoA dehydrogenase [Saprospiraceae bacterium]|nr:3-hydroxybutyryl-CoA dehydrogenase [Saprospiraceae bacterium]